MASYDAIINLKLKGLNQLKEVDRAITNITGGGTGGRAGSGRGRGARQQLRVEKSLTNELKRQKDYINSINELQTDPVSKAIRRNQKLQAKRRRVNLSERVSSRFLTGQRSEAATNIRVELKRRGKEEEALQKKLQEMDQKSLHINKARRMERKRSLSLGNDIVRQKTKEVELEVKAREARLKGRSTGFSASQYGPQQFSDPGLQGQSSPLNFGRRGELLRGRAGTNRFSLRNIGRRFDRQSALVSGAFPLLFGQGPVGALAGGLGGGIGGMFGQMGGFAGGIAATAVVQQIQQAITAVGDLGKAMSPFTQNTQALANALGLVGTPAGKYLETLEQTQGKQVAFNEAMRRMENLVGVNGVKALQDFGEGTRKLQQDITTFLTRIAAKAAELLNNIGGGGGGGTGRPVGLARANLLAQGRNTTTGPLADEIQEVVAKLETANRKTRAGLQDELIELVKKRNLLQKNLDITNDANAKFEKTLENLTQENEHLQNVLQLGKEGAQIEQEKLRVAKDLTMEVGKLTPEQVKQIANSVKLNNQLKEQRQIQEQIQNILAGGMTNAVMGLIEGTKTLGQVLADVARQLASMFLNQAFMKIFGSMFGGGFDSTFGTGIPSGSNLPAGSFGIGSGGGVGASASNLTRHFASGGYVSGPTMGLIGEAGESEYVIPASKMSGAMSRYSAGARGGAVIPGGSGDSGTVAGSSGNTVVEYTGPTLNFNGDEYVPKSAVPEIIGAAAKRGAVAGRAQVIGSLKNSRSQRSSLGL